MRRNQLFVLTLSIFALGAFFAAGCNTELSQRNLTFACGPDQPCAEGFECRENPELEENVCVVKGTTFADVGLDADETPDISDGDDAGPDADTADATDTADTADATDTADGNDADVCVITNGGQEQCDGLDNDCNGLRDDWCHAQLLGTDDSQNFGKDWGWDVATDSGGNVYVVGYVDGMVELQNYIGGVHDAFIAKYTAQGTLEWVRLLGSAGDDRARGVAVHSTGDVYVTGFTDGDLGGETASGVWDAFLAKYNSAGVRQWVKLLGAATVSAQAYGVAVSDSGSRVYIAGKTSGKLLSDHSHGGGTDAFLAHFDSANSDIRWVKPLGSGGEDAGQDVVTVDEQPYLVGWVSGDPESATPTAKAKSDAFVARFAANNGALDWVEWSPTEQMEKAYGAAADSGGNIYLAGTFDRVIDRGPPEVLSADGFVEKYTTNGKQEWREEFATDEQDYAEDLTVDANDRVYVTGWTEGKLGASQGDLRDVFVASLDANNGDDGAPIYQWATTASAAAYGVVGDGVGNVYVTGRTTGSLDEQTYNGGISDAFVVKLPRD
jgi:hypothetical protein